MSTKVADIPEVPNFDAVADVIAHADEYANFGSTPSLENVFPTQKDPLVIAAEDYARACRVHMDATSQVAKAKQTLEGAKKQEEDTYKQRVEAQSKLAEMVSKTTEAVL